MHMHICWEMLICRVDPPFSVYHPDRITDTIQRTCQMFQQEVCRTWSEVVWREKTHFEDKTRGKIKITPSLQDSQKEEIHSGQQLRVVPTLIIIALVIMIDWPELWDFMGMMLCLWCFPLLMMSQLFCSRKDLVNSCDSSEIDSDILCCVSSLPRWAGALHLQHLATRMLQRVLRYICSSFPLSVLAHSDHVCLAPIYCVWCLYIAPRGQKGCEVEIIALPSVQRDQRCDRPQSSKETL